MRTCVYQEVKNVSFLENFVNVQNEWCLIHYAPYLNNSEAFHNMTKYCFGTYKKKKKKNGPAVI